MIIKRYLGILLVFLAPRICFGMYPVYRNNHNVNPNLNPNTVNLNYYNYNNLQQRQNYINQPVLFNNNRITGKVPRFSNNHKVNAMYQYYKPEYYDRLADSGLYIGFGVGYSVSMMGGIEAYYKDEKKSFSVPGAFVPAPFDYDKVFPLQFVVGASVNSDLRVDFSYLRVSGMEYADTVETYNGVGMIKVKSTGGAMTTNATMVNFYYNVDSYTGYLAGGSLRPYIGAGIGISLNTIADYIVYDGSLYSEKDPATVPAGTLTAVSDIYAYHNGGTSEQVAYMLEGGVSTDLDGGVKADIFLRYSGFGLVRTSGSISVSQTEWLADGNGGETQAPYDSVFHYTDWVEGGALNVLDVGVKLRLQF